MTSKKDSTEKTVMDPSVHEESNPGVSTSNQQRLCWSLETLASEVEALFPETVLTPSNYTGRNVALDGQFASEKADHDVLRSLLHLVRDDERVAGVLVDDSDRVILVSFHKNTVTQDSRDPFGLSEAYDVITEMEGSS